MTKERAQAERFYADRVVAIRQAAKPGDGKPVVTPPQIAIEPEPPARPDPLRPALSVLIFMVAQCVLFGVGAIIILGTSLASLAYWLMAPMIIVTTVLSAVAAWIIEPRLRARNRARRYDAESFRDPATRRR